MIKASIFLLSGALVVTSACGGGPGNPHDACNQIGSSVCEKLFQCVAPDVLKNQLGYTDQEDCTIKLQTQANCTNITTCPSGTTYSSANASTCIDDIKSSQCINTVSTPPSCQTICQ